jgi:serine/threonine protein kinase
MINFMVCNWRVVPMRYQKVKELSSETMLLHRMATGETVAADQVDIKANLKEGFRLELHNDIRKLAAEEAKVQVAGLIQYQGLEKIDGDFYLVRKNGKDYTGIERYQSLSLAKAIPVLLHLAKVMDAYHRQGLILGGLSPGLLQCNPAQEVLLQDPPVINHLAKLLEGKYEFSLPVEVIKGQSWGAEADVFSWGELAYRLLTGEAPFAAAQPEDRAAKVIAGLVIDPRNIQPQLSEACSRLIMSCLAIEPQRRPTTAELLRQWEALVSRKKCLAPAEEVILFEEKAALHRKRQQSRERFRLWWRKYGLTWCGISGAVIVLLLIVFAPKQTILSSRTTPDEVVNYYFQAIRTVNVPLLDETIHRPKNDLSEVISNIHVINASRKANEMQFNGENAIKVRVEMLNIQKERATPAAVAYRVKYRIKFDMANEINYLSREDRFRLTPVRRVWRITKINILKQKRWSKKKKAQPVGKTGKELPGTPARP